MGSSLFGIVQKILRPEIESMGKSAAGPCKKWCFKNKKPWAQKCNWKNCNGCDSCQTNGGFFSEASCKALFHGTDKVENSCEVPQKFASWRTPSTGEFMQDPPIESDEVQEFTVAGSKYVQIASKRKLSVAGESTESKWMLCVRKVKEPKPTGTKYLGCHMDHEARDLKHGPKQYGYKGPGGPMKCARACPEYKYIALQNGGSCHCDNTYGTAIIYHKRPNHECGRSLPRPGGKWRNAVYSVQKGHTLQSAVPEERCCVHKYSTLAPSVMQAVQDAKDRNQALDVANATILKRAAARLKNF